MREMICRGKRTNNGEWVEGYLVKYPSAVQIGDCSPWYIVVPPADPDDSGGTSNVIPETVRMHLASGKLKGVKIGGAWRVTKEELMDVLDVGKAGS